MKQYVPNDVPKIGEMEIEETKWNSDVSKHNYFIIKNKVLNNIPIHGKPSRIFSYALYKTKTLLLLGYNVCSLFKNKVSLEGGIHLPYKNWLAPNKTIQLANRQYQIVRNDDPDGFTNLFLH